ncbi:Hypothetical predicted protein [Paramuricea clavata]|uniref:Uncharacterized protein n=1 Tax=Paramuricea clavata TaxID=317549 RepID=A0A7D9IAA2_PARCT|nr:Hypothetical predicted protein [Paramuricea clavata]
MLKIFTNIFVSQPGFWSASGGKYNKFCGSNTDLIISWNYDLGNLSSKGKIGDTLKTFFSTSVLSIEDESSHVAQTTLEAGGKGIDQLQEFIDASYQKTLAYELSLAASINSSTTFKPQPVKSSTLNPIQESCALEWMLDDAKENINVQQFGGLAPSCWRQLKINGNIVNVPAHVVNNVNLLPRPNKVAEAAKWLVNNGNLYKDEGITFNDTWLEDNSNTQMVFDDSDNDQTSEGSENVLDCNAESLNCDTECKTQQSSACDDDDEHWSEDEAEIPAGITDTMLTSPDFVTDNERQHILNVAPVPDVANPMSDSALRVLHNNIIHYLGMTEKKFTAVLFSSSEET